MLINKKNKKYIKNIILKHANLQKKYKKYVI